jgi:hypothetical protein
MKILFAKKYIEISVEKNGKWIPKWIKSIKFDINKKWKEIKKVKEENEIVDIWDVFWNTENKEENEVIFNKELFITTLKEIWAKWGLIMWLKVAEFYNDWNILEIKSKTAFALKQIDTDYNRQLIDKALEKMWLWSLEVKLK